MLQNISGAALATVWGAHPAYGVLIGSLSFVGGPGTAMAWAKELQAQGLQNAQVVAVGAATLAVIVGALVSGPVTGWIVKRHKLHGQGGRHADVTFAPPPPVRKPKAADAGQIESLLSTRVRSRTRRPDGREAQRLCARGGIAAARLSVGDDCRRCDHQLSPMSSSIRLTSRRSRRAALSHFSSSS